MEKVSIIIKLRRVTLAPPLARFSLRLSTKVAEVLDRMPFLVRIIWR